MYAIHAVSIDAVHAAAQLAARPHAPVSQGAVGEVRIADVLVYVPSTYRPERPVGLLVMLHGADGNAERALSFVQAIAEDRELVVIAPKSAERSWDLIRGGFGPDVAQLDRALAGVFDAYAIDPARIAIAGFSDGASYALTLGFANGTLFETVLAFSPGFEAAPRRVGKPRVFVAHGRKDKVLPIERTSRQLVKRFKRRKHVVSLVEFDGGHAMPGRIVRAAFAFWLDVRPEI